MINVNRMKRIKILILFCCITSISYSQRIRKEWSELTDSENSKLYVALSSLDHAFVDEMADEHRRLFGSGIHDFPDFLPWHRIFIYELERRILAIEELTTLPYWNWYNTWDENSILFGTENIGSILKT